MPSISHSSDRILDRIIFPVILCNPKNLSINICTNCLLDTGATVSCISNEVIDKLKLSICKETMVSDASGLFNAFTYKVNVFLKKDMHFSIEATKLSQFPEEISIGFILGMDILSKGDLLISNSKNYTFMSFTV